MIPRIQNKWNREQMGKASIPNTQKVGLLKINYVKSCILHQKRVEKAWQANISSNVVFINKKNKKKCLVFFFFLLISFQIKIKNKKQNNPISF